MTWLASPVQQRSLRLLSHYLTVLAVTMAAFSALLAYSWHVELSGFLRWIVLPCQAALAASAYAGAYKSHPINTGLYLAGLLISTLLLGAFLHETGGHTNPLISLLLLPVAMSAAMLFWQSTVLLALATLLIYGALTHYFKPLVSTGAASLHNFMELHLIGMWLTFILSVALLVGVVVPLVSAMRSQRERIAAQREQMLRDERLVAMATFAASAAHQLGTPLSTVAVLIEELREDHQPYHGDLEVMSQQIDLCKQILHSMMRRAEDIRADAKRVASVATLVQQLREQFALLHPLRVLRVGPFDCGHLELEADLSLEQALLNLLDNSIKATPVDPELSLHSDRDWLFVRIRDEGPGIPEKVRERLGEPYVSSRRGGTGLGLFLSHATIDRLGGTLSLQASPNGTLFEIRLPLLKSGPSSTG